MIGAAAYQPYAFFLCAAIGLMAGLLYCVLAPVRRQSSSNILAFVLDSCFWLCATAGFLYGMYISTGGVFRLFSMLALVTGFAIFVCGPGYFVIKCETKMLRRIAKGLKKLSESIERDMGKAD